MTDEHTNAEAAENTKDAKINELALSVLKLSRNTLVVNLRFMDTAISRLRWAKIADVIAKNPRLLPAMFGSIMTEGTAIVYDPVAVCKMYAAEHESVPRTYLHMVMHCIFRHFAPNPTFDRSMWNVACDMAVENMINEMYMPQLTVKRSAQQNTVISEVAPEVNNLCTTEKLYYWMQQKSLSEQRIAELGELFKADDHIIWYKPDIKNAVLQIGKSGEKSSQKENGVSPERPSYAFDEADSLAALAKEWSDVSEKMQTNLETFAKERGDSAGNMMQNLREVNREKYDYTEFLKKFAVMGEVMHINDDEFDYVFYTYGMRLFPEKKLPLIEPLEYKEMKRIREFVIALDTSGSVEGEQVQSFLEKTYNILKSTDSFFSKINLHIIQCDAEIQEDVKITCQEEFDNYLSRMKIKGLGGTDFRPVFSRVDKMIANHEFVNLKGLIYFTDGYGVFPEHMPPYKTAFVFVQDGYEIPEIPAWAIRLVLQHEDL